MNRHRLIPDNSGAIVTFFVISSQVQNHCTPPDKVVVVIQSKRTSLVVAVHAAVAMSFAQSVQAQLFPATASTT